MIKMQKRSKKVERTKSRALKMFARTASSGFKENYIAAIQVSRIEAPGQSSPSLLFAKDLGRDLNLLSKGELRAAVHALFLPELDDLHDQKLLSPFPTTHPLYGHPGMSGEILSGLVGTMEICEQLGYRHPIARDDLVEAGAAPQHIAFPYTGDLLLILKTSTSYRCVNWPIKRSREQFGHEDSSIEERNSEELKLKRKAHRRLEIETRYYAHCGIPTIPIAFDDFSQIASRNLFYLLNADRHAPQISMQNWKQMVAEIKCLQQREYSINQIAGRIALGFGYPIDISANFVCKAIWRHEVNVDMYKAIFPDRPLNEERSNLLNDIRSKWLKVK